MFHFLEYPFSRGSTSITSPSCYDTPDFDAGFMNDKRDMAPMGKSLQAMSTDLSINVLAILT
jgi:hypothetical protein